MMDDNIIISFIIPIYNTIPFLLEKSVLSIVQSDIPQNTVEVLLVNDGSTNSETVSKCEELVRDYQGIKLFSQENQGVSVARNKGIIESKGKYLVFVDPDDYMSSQLSDLLFKLESEESDIILFSYYRENKDGCRQSINIDSGIQLKKVELINNTLFCGREYPDYYAGAVWAKAFKRIFVLNNSLIFDQNLRKAQDRVFMLYAYNKADTLKYIDIPYYCYFQNLESVCNKYNKNALTRSLSFLEAVEAFLETNEVQNKKYLSAMVRYISYFEILYLYLFNYEAKETTKESIVSAKKLYKELNISDVTKKIRSNDFIGANSKIKYLLVKFRLFYLLRFIIRKRQEKLHLD